MDVLKFKIVILIFASMTLLSGCQAGYLLKSASGQLSLMNKRVPIETALLDPKISTEEKNKIRLAQEAREFGEQFMGLSNTKNYSDFVALDQPYVTYVVSAAPMWELKHFIWDFPIVGSLPYKGFFKEFDAKNEENELKDKKLDTYLRGVSAYSTLGWFKDPLLSSMLRYKEHALVNTIIHESVHATLYIKSSADFNERLAVFLGNAGTEAFYLKKEGSNSKTLKQIRNENYDEKIFSEFISNEINDLENWYKTMPTHDENLRKNRLKEIQTHFVKNIKLKMKSNTYENFENITLNNARLLVYKVYVANLADFSNLFEKVNHDFYDFIKNCKKLEKHKKPEVGLKELILNLNL